MSVLAIVITIIVTVVLIKTNCIGKVLRFVKSYVIWPTLIGIIGAIIFHLIGIKVIVGYIVGVIIGNIFNITRDSSKTN